ncbi:MAG: HD domain-containing protein [Candidatus Woesearchaeota archaeon]|jgi:hypothetical protein|nr:HD domain-containing protein [Candidatus Woesearchaeota archaeon]MDP7181332.1 HD domain-containing protein [Candidatus Woesearchaeota archaeon]MDP7198049.1 HD domain-containing protein [Candidatus Woesearchaeota archaeon]MDP7466883.1 HD domain-containing protein [Candidatus Woesearchaeota archaeon]MDP7647319.1 HD domain-containing protein [Candidatus Woesearchaeota archaeon]
MTPEDLEGMIVEANAKVYAELCHRGQTRKDDTTPYVVHPATVAEYAEQYGVDDSDVLAAAWLHDVVEDTDATLADIKERFGMNVEWYVDCLTQRKPNESNDKYANRIVMDADFKVQIVKMCDVLHNSETLGEIVDPAKKEKATKNMLHVWDTYYQDVAKRLNTDLAERIESTIGVYREYNYKQAISVSWIESERGWGFRPDGCSLHFSEEDYGAYVKEYWADMPDEVPDEYSKPIGDPVPVTVGGSLLVKLKESEKGIRLFQVEEGKRESQMQLVYGDRRSGPVPTE